jgi:hypothetical protein
MEEPSPEFSLSERQRQVYDMIVKGGIGGISRTKLFKELFDGKSDVSLRTCVARINQQITPQRLRGRGKRYFLEV